MTQLERVAGAFARVHESDVAEPAAIAAAARDLTEGAFAHVRLQHGGEATSGDAAYAAYAEAPGQSDAVVTVPMMVDVETLGVITVVRPERFSTETLRGLMHFARVAALLVSAARNDLVLRRQREQFAMVARVGSIITAGLDVDELLQRAADSIHELLGYNNIAIPLIDEEDPETLVIRAVGGEYKKFIREEWRFPVSQGVLGSAVREQRVQVVDDVTADPRYVHTPGAIGIRSELAVPILLAGRVLGVLNVEDVEPFDANDVETLQIVAGHLAVAVNNAQLFRRAQQAVVLEERHRLARDLHDSVTQTIASVHMLAQSLAPAWKRDPDTGSRNTDRVVELTRSALNEMRAMLHELRPVEGGHAHVSLLSILHNGGLQAALTDLAEKLATDSVPITVDTTGKRYERDTEEALFRIAQESVANALRHARASAIRIEVSDSGSVVSMRVEDDGCGVPDALPATGRGLRHMRERAEALGGEFSIARREHPPGTMVTVTIPAAGSN